MPAMNIPLAHGNYIRGVAKEARILARNRYYEDNPVLTKDGVAMLARMGMRRYITGLGEGPVRTIYSQPGSFDDDVFVVSATNLYRISRTLNTATLITAGMGSGTPLKGVSMAATSNIGTTPEFLFIADGAILWVYNSNSYASGTLGGVPVNTDTVRLGSVYYKFTNASVDAGAPDGTVANPWLVELGGTSLESFTNLGDAINASGLNGTQYSTALVTDNDQAQYVTVTGGSIVVQATAVGALGNAVVTTETGSLAWGAGTLGGGGVPGIRQVQTPDDVGMVSVGYIASQVVCVPTQGQGVNGRFYWIEPGETTIDPLNFATAERAPDPVYEVVVFGDQFWLPGQTTTEVWYFSGDPDAPVLRLQGVTFDRGTWEGTAIQVKDAMIIVDSDGNVFKVEGGIEEMSNASIAERIREAMQKQASYPFL